MTPDKTTQTRSNPSPSDVSRPGVSRRKFLGASSISAAVLAAPATLLAGCTPEKKPEPKGDKPPAAPATSSPSCSLVPFSEPSVESSDNGEVQFTMNVQMNSVTLERNKSVGVENVQTRSYNGEIPGPTISVNPGDQIRITLNNWLPPNQGDCTPNCPNCFNTTNLHFHGLHVSPSSICDQDTGEKILSSDDVLYELEPSPNYPDEPTTHENLVWLPKFHAPGTHWYHAHRHGSTAVQVSNGMIGAIIIKDPPEYRIVDDHEDKIWIIQEVVGVEDTSIYCAGSGARAGGNPPNQPGLFLINGKLQPTITVQKGKIQRWRFINGTASPRGLMNLKLVKAESCDPNASVCCETFCCEDTCQDAQGNPLPLCGQSVDMHLIAVDGISFYCKAPQPTQAWNMSPGNRADFLIQLTEPGWYKVVKDTFSGNGANASGASTQVLGYVRVPEDGPTYNESIPDVIPGTPPGYLLPINPSEIVNSDAPKNIQFSINTTGGGGGSSNSGGSYLINNELYDLDCANIEVELGTAEVWELTATGGSAHPFHIHVNPFQLVGDKIDPNGPDDSTNWRWWDTIAVQPPSGGQQPTPLEIWQRFSTYYGEFVFHCHILVHEDQGMMQNVRVKPTATNPGIPPACSSDYPLLGNAACEWPANGEPCPIGTAVCPPPPDQPEPKPDCSNAETCPSQSQSPSPSQSQSPSQSPSPSQSNQPKQGKTKGS